MQSNSATIRGLLFQDLFLKKMYWYKLNKGTLLFKSDNLEITFTIQEIINIYTFARMTENNHKSISNLGAGQAIVINPLKSNEKTYDLYIIEKTPHDKYEIYFISIKTGSKYKFTEKLETEYMNTLKAMGVKDIDINKVHIYYLIEQSYNVEKFISKNKKLGLILWNIYNEEFHIVQKSAPEIKIPTMRMENSNTRTNIRYVKDYKNMSTQQLKTSKRNIEQELLRRKKKNETNIENIHIKTEIEEETDSTADNCSQFFN
jgi:hypothetical protein